MRQIVGLMKGFSSPWKLHGVFPLKSSVQDERGLKEYFQFQKIAHRAIYSELNVVEGHQKVFVRFYLNCHNYNFFIHSLVTRHYSQLSGCNQKAMKMKNREIVQEIMTVVGKHCSYVTRKCDAVHGSCTWINIEKFE